MLTHFSNEIKGMFNGKQEQSAFADTERSCSFDT
jgi:hypothetical protein